MTLLTTTRRNRPLSVFDDMDHTLQSLFGDSMFGSLRPTLALDTTAMQDVFNPPVDIQETERSYELHADLPGLSKADINLELNENVLTLSGERTVERKSDDDGQYRYERRSGKFQRSFSLPQEIQADKIDASFNDGVLHVSLPKAAPSQPNRQSINIK